MRKSNKILITLLLTSITISIFALLSYKNNNTYIEKILKTEDYSYLPEEAKDLIREQYSTNGVLLKTEHNASQDEPYLNPAYIFYLNKSPEEKYETGYIPNVYTINPSEESITKATESLGVTIDPRVTLSSYSLENAYLTSDMNKTGKQTTPIKDQKDRGFCWAYSTSSVAENYILTTTGTEFSETSKIFSPIQLHYISAYNSIIDYRDEANIYYTKYSSATGNFSNPRSVLETEFISNIGGYDLDKPYPSAKTDLDGGNFQIASVAYSRGLSMVDDSSFTTDIQEFNYITSDGYTLTPAVTFTNTTPKQLSEVLNYSKSNYELNKSYEITESYNVSTRDYESIIKNSIVNYGGVTIGTVSPISGGGNDSSYCATKNYNGDSIIDQSNECNAARYISHQMHIIGWDDDYEYGYCVNPASDKLTRASGANLTSLSCDGGYTLTKSGKNGKEKGAWLVKNSWGEGNDSSYLYLTYDSVYVSLGSILDLSPMATRSWDNEYSIDGKQSNYITPANTYDITSRTEKGKYEKLESIKFRTTDPDASYDVCIANPDTWQCLPDKTVNVNSALPGYVTVDLSSFNYVFDDIASVSIESKGYSDYFALWGVSAFTSNVVYDEENDRYIKDTEESIYPSTETILLSDLQRNDSTYSYKKYLTTRNIPAGEEAVVHLSTYENSTIKNLDTDYNLTVPDKTVALNNINSVFTFSDSLPDDSIYALTETVNDEQSITLFEKGTAKDANITVRVNTFESSPLGKIYSDTDDTTTSFKISQTIKPLSNSTLTFTATEPAPGYHFSHWEKQDGTIIGKVYTEEELIENFDNKNLTRPKSIHKPTLTIEKNPLGYYSDTEIIANFEEESVNLSFAIQADLLPESTSLEDAFLLNVDGSDLAENTTSFSTNISASTTSAPNITVKVKPAYSDYYDFSGWYIGDTLISSAQTFIPAKISGAYKSSAYIAKFSVKKKDIYICVLNDSTEACTVSDNNFGNITNLPVTDDGKIFENIDIFTIESIKSTINSAETANLTVKNTTFTAVPKTKTNSTEYSFAGWAFQNKPANSLTVYAKFASKLRDYKIAIEVDSSTLGTITPLPNNITMPYGTSISIKTNGTITVGNQTLQAIPNSTTAEDSPMYDYVFDMWTEQILPDCDSACPPSEPAINITKNSTISLSSNIIFKAQFKKSPRPITISFDLNGATSPDSLPEINTHYTESLTEPTNVTKTGHDLLGWYIDLSDNTTKWDFNKPIDKSQSSLPAANFTLHALWSVHTHTIFFDFGKGTYQSEGNFTIASQPYNTKLNSTTPFPTPQRDNYIFSGWFDATGKEWKPDDNMPDFDLNLTAKWLPENLTLSISDSLSFNNTTRIIDFLTKNTTVSSLKTNIAVNPPYEVTFKSKSNSTLTDNALIGTGTKILIAEPDSGEIVDIITLIIRGDINGDGLIKSSDYVFIKNHIMTTSLLTDIYLQAADFDNSGTVKSSDYVKIKNLIMEK